MAAGSPVRYRLKGSSSTTFFGRSDSLKRRASAELDEHLRETSSPQNWREQCNSTSTNSSSLGRGRSISQDEEEDDLSGGGSDGSDYVFVGSTGFGLCGGVRTKVAETDPPKWEKKEETGSQDDSADLMERTNTYVQWPSRMKLGAKTKKDLYVRVYGHDQEEVNEAKNQILADLGPHRDLRITLKMEISYTDHSHLIGCRGQTIRKVMDDTGCHIHFPDSNRMSKEHKSNQVTIAGSSIGSVEQARARVRELSPLVFQFNMPTLHSPYEMQINPEAHHVFIDNIQSTYGVQVTIHPPNKLQQTSVSVKGCEIDSDAVRCAVGKIVAYFSGNNNMSSVQVESTMEITPIQHPFVRAVNDSNVHAIMMNTGAKIIFPDLTDGNIQQIKRSRVYISGEINCVYNARQQLLGCLPLRMIFDLADEFHLEWDVIRQVGQDMNVNVKLINRNRGGMDRSSGGGGGLSSLPPPVPGRSRTIQLIAHERNTSNLFEVRRRILGGMEQMFSASIPQNYMLRPTYPTSEVKASLQYGNRLGVGPPMGSLPPLMLPTSPNMQSPVLSPSFWPPSPFASPFCSPSIATCVVNGSTNNNNTGGGGSNVGYGGLMSNMHNNPGGGGNGNNNNHGYGMSTSNNGGYGHLHHIAGYGHNEGMSNNSNNGYDSIQMGGGGGGRNGPPPGIGKLTLNLQHGLNYGYNGPLPSPSPVNMHPPEISINNMKHSFHLPLVDPHNYNMLPSQGYQHHHGHTDSALNTPMSLGGTSTFSDLSPMTSHPGVGMVNAILNDFNDMDFKRRAPGCERANTAPNLFVNLPSGGLLKNGGGSGSTSGSASRSESPSLPTSNNEPTASAATGGADSLKEGNDEKKDPELTVEKDDGKETKEEDNSSGEKVVNPDPTHDKKYMAVKAMYHTKIGPDTSPRVPNSEWSGCGFSKTYLNLFRTDNSNADTNRTDLDSGLGPDADGENAPSSGSGAVSDIRKVHFPIGHQQSNLLDFYGPSRPMDGNLKPPTDLASLFIRNGLGKFIDKFISEEIDLGTFASLNESDLRSLGVSAYPARKRMLVLITQLACPRLTEDWNQSSH